MKWDSMLLTAMRLLALSLALIGCSSISDQDYYDKVSRENDEHWRRMFDPSPAHQIRADSRKWPTRTRTLENSEHTRNPHVTATGIRPRAKSRVQSAIGAPSQLL